MSHSRPSCSPLVPHTHRKICSLRFQMVIMFPSVGGTTDCCCSVHSFDFYIYIFFFNNQEPSSGPWPDPCGSGQRTMMSRVKLKMRLLEGDTVESLANVGVSSSLSVHWKNSYLYSKQHRTRTVIVKLSSQAKQWQRYAISSANVDKGQIPNPKWWFPSSVPFLQMLGLCHQIYRGTPKQHIAE